jgi:prepilin-type N-terminal cleavage/methylation domain-containing protein
MKNAGFTLIELLTVVTIIGVLSTMGVVAYLSAQPRARDARRKSDLEQYKNALEVYATKNNGFYPSRTDVATVQASTTVCTDLGLTGCSEDPLFSSNAVYHYSYQSDGTNLGTATATKYFLSGPLEGAAGSYWVFCSNGKSGQLSGWPGNSSAGDCPNGL